jgi:hypothetical protein
VDQQGWRALTDPAFKHASAEIFCLALRPVGLLSIDLIGEVVEWVGFEPTKARWPADLQSGVFDRLNYHSRYNARDHIVENH